MRYAVFLRGINVGGIKVPMAELRECLAGLEVSEVQTLLQSGNVLLTSALSASRLRTAMERALTETFDYTAHVLVYRQSELPAILEGYPFDHDEDHHRYVIFCDSQKTADTVAGAAGADEAVAVGRRVVYWSCPKGATLKTPFSKVLADRTLRTATTNRNLNTVEKMLR